jgi:hypothetical protein
VAILAVVLLLLPGCGRLFGEHVPAATGAEDVKRAAFEIVARGNQCEPEVLAADREGRAILITFKVTSVGKEHYFLIPDLGVRKVIPTDMEVSILVRVERSGIYQYGCTGSRWLLPWSSKAKLAIR